MRLLEIKSKLLEPIDYRSIDIVDDLPRFTVDMAKLNKDMKRCQYSHAKKENVEIVEVNDLVHLSCTSEDSHFNLKDRYVIVGKNLWDKQFEQKLVGAKLGKQTIEFDGKEVEVEIDSIVRNTVDPLIDENVKKWAIDGVETVEGLRHMYFNRQVEAFLQDSEEADMVVTLLCNKTTEHAKFDIDAKDKAAMEKAVSQQIETARMMRQKMIEMGEIDENEPWDIEGIIPSMIESTLKASIIGYDLLTKEGYEITEEDYIANIKNRAIQLNVTEQEAMASYDETDYAMEMATGYFFDLLEKRVGVVMKEVYWRQNKNKKDVYDVAIVGAGPAGLSAALTLNVHNKSIIWFGSKKLSEKVEKSEMIVNYAGFGAISGKELNEQFRKQIRKNELDLNDQMVTQIQKSKKGFMILADNEIYQAKTVLLAIGSVPPKGLKNEQELLGHGVSYCATCDGFLYKGKKIGVFCGNPRYEHEVEYLAELADTVYLYTTYKDSKVEAKNIVHLQKPMKEVVGENKVSGIRLADESEIEVSGMFFLRSAVAPTTILRDLQMDGAHIVIDRHSQTNIEGVYAAGDCTGRPYQIAKALGEGNVAAHSIVEYLANK